MESRRIDPDRRAHDRVVYTPPIRPVFMVETSTFEILDCSEVGMAVALVCRSRDAAVPPLGSILSGVVAFPSGVQVNIDGKVVRVDDDTIGISLQNRGIPFAVLLNERDGYWQHHSRP